MDSRDILIALHHIEGVGWKTISKILAHYTDLTQVLNISQSQWQAIGLKPQQIERILIELQPDSILKVISKYTQQHIGIMTIWDKDYPPLLKETSQAPWVLYYKGDPTLLTQPLLAIVGTRAPTHYGKKVAQEFAASLSGIGIGIVSGLARGIDSYAHIGALQQRSKTIAVMGTAIDQLYPMENKSLHEQIVQEGVVVSEYPIGTSMHVGMFPQRNRIIAGLSLGVIVVEAAHRSGSLITVDRALDENREIYAVPGPITSLKSMGTLHLIKQGCKMVTSMEDITEDLQHLLPTYVSHSPVHAPLVLSVAEQTIYAFIEHESCTVDELHELSAYDIGYLHTILLSLLSKKCIHQLPGFRYEKARI
jgi:DNA processing protein